MFEIIFSPLVNLMQVKKMPEVTNLETKVVFSPQDIYI